MGGFEERWTSRKDELTDSQKFLIARIEEARKATTIPNNPIAALSEEDYKKLFWAAQKLEKNFEIEILSNKNDQDEKKLIIAFGNVVMFNNSRAENDSQETFNENVNIIYDKAFYDDMTQCTTKPNAFFTNSYAYQNDLLADIKTVGTSYADTLDKNNFTRYGFSSDNYRAMQDVIKAFNEKYEDANHKILNDPNTLKEMKKDLHKVLSTIQKYVDGKGGFNKKGKNDYEDRRIRAAARGYNQFLKLYGAVSATEASISRRDTLYKLEKSINDKCDNIESTLPEELNPFYMKYSEGIRNIVKIYDGYNHSLTPEQQKDVVQNFEKMCEFQLRQMLYKKDDYRGIATSLTSEEVMEYVRSTNEYKRLFADPTKINVNNTIYQILSNEGEKRVLIDTVALDKFAKQKVPISNVYLASQAELKKMANLDNKELEKAFYGKYARMEEKLPEELKVRYKCFGREDDGVPTGLVWIYLGGYRDNDNGNVDEAMYYFDRMAAFQLRRQLYQHKEYRELAFILGDDVLEEHIKSTKEYKEFAGDGKNISRKEFKKVFLEELECKVFGNYKEFANKQLENISEHRVKFIDSHPDWAKQFNIKNEPVKDNPVKNEPVKNNQVLGV